MITDVKKAAELLKSNDDFLILSHANPDGDTLGCAYGLCGMLQKMGKRAKVMCADEIAPRMEFLRDTVIQQNFEEKTIVSVDVADRKLLGDLDAVYGGRIFLAIDHHEKTGVCKIYSCRFRCGCGLRTYFSDSGGNERTA